jgi:hypothetical protein
MLARLRRRQRADRMGRVAAALALILAAGCSLVLDFGDRADAAPEADAPVADALGTDAPDPCNELEPNDEIATAAVIVPGTYPGLAICPAGDRDFYRFEVAANADVVVEITFDNRAGAGDLDLRLYGPLGAVVASSAGFGDVERIERSLAMENRLDEGEYTAEVYGATVQVENEYQLTLSIVVDDPGK